jgi:hypothetical protein
MPVAARNSVVLAAAYSTPGGQHFPAAHLVAQVTQHSRRKQGAQHVGGEDHGDPQRAETELPLVPHVQRDGQRPASMMANSTAAVRR